MPCGGFGEAALPGGTHLIEGPETRNARALPRRQLVDNTTTPVDLQPVGVTMAPGSRSEAVRASAVRSRHHRELRPGGSWISDTPSRSGVFGVTMRLNTHKHAEA